MPISQYKFLYTEKKFIAPRGTMSSHPPAQVLKSCVFCQVYLAATMLGTVLRKGHSVKHMTSTHSQYTKAPLLQCYCVFDE